MIRINLLGQLRPKAAKKAVPMEAGVQVIFLILAILASAIVLFTVWRHQKVELDATEQRISNLNSEKASLQQVKRDVEQYESQKAILQQRINVIENLQRNRTGGQELLQMVANTVVRVDSVWLTQIERKGDSLEIAGEAGSINAVANFITQLKRSGYFGKVEIKEAKEDDLVKTAQTFGFTMSAAINALPTEGQPQTQPAGTSAPSQPAPKGRS
jgi:type IV pilus assembly protein PilN